MIYRTRPADSKSEDGVYRSTIKVILNPHNLKESVLEQTSYGLQDENGWFTIVSSLTNNDTNCPVFKAWKTCRYSKDPNLNAQSTTKDKGGRGLFDKRFARYVTVQVIEDNNQPDLVGKYMFMKLPKAIWEMITNKMNPSPESKKAAIPVMDFLFGRAIELEVKPGPDDPNAPERKTRETSYAGSELSEDIVSCINPDGTAILDDSQQAILDEYVNQMTKLVWKEKDPEKRTANLATINASENTVKLREIYKEVMEQIKSVCPNLTEELGYKPWTPEVTERVNRWIATVVAGGDPASMGAPAVVKEVAEQVVEEVTDSSEDEELPF
ncbi:MAG: hypothetical protein J1F35_06015 [Erysipelotrichales bacterium]|nr:hypothetical protein [Erysipelotrichales bacterium]